VSTPPYLPPDVGPAGLTVASYPSILADNLQAFLNIYGSNQYIGQDASIYQLLSILSLKQADQNAALQLNYNQSSPQTAVGAGLDRVVKMNGLARLPFTYSTAALTCVGTPGLVLTQCFAQDQVGNLWALPSPTTLVGGSVTVTATCTTPGNVTAEPGTINIVASPVNGPSGTWTSVTNAVAATPGDPVEPDSSLRARQSVSVALPALTPIAATVAAVLATTGVVRVAPGYPTPGGPGSSIENPTGATDSWGNPAHSISIVAQGGSPAAVCLSIYLKKTIGCLTNGTTSSLVTDPNTGYQETISYYQPTFLPIFVNVVLVGYGSAPTTAQLAAVQAAVVTYLNELAIGETVSYSALIYEIMAVNATLISPGFGVQAMQIGSVVACATTATTVVSTASIVVASAAGVANGQLVLGAGIPPNTFVTGYVSGTTVGLTNNATASASGVAVQFVTVGASDVAMPTFYTVAQGAAGNVEVSAS
jgi:uncharacterized phage protein gp47/JayE